MNDEKRFAGKALECPLATKDVFENTKNRDWTIENFALVCEVFLISLVVYNIAGLYSSSKRKAKVA